MASTDQGTLYVDSSSLLAWILGQSGSEAVRSRVESWLSRGGEVISSRLLELEVRRTLVRERLSGNEIPPASERLLGLVELLPVTEEVWQRAVAIEQHVRAPDAIHLATCELVAATLLTAGLDHTLGSVAATRGIPTV